MIRIIAQHKGLYKGLSADGSILNCRISGRMEFESNSRADLPAIGDWCEHGAPMIDESGQPAVVIGRVRPRVTAISRKSQSDEQVLAANVDWAFLVMSANRDFNLNRIDRYVLIARRGGVEPVLVLSKADLADSLQTYSNSIAESWPDLPIVIASIPENRGIDEIAARLTAGKTGVFLGSSGAGKSSLINALLGRPAQATGEIRSDDERGRHTTSAGALFFVPGGGAVIDTPGLREIGILGDEEDLSSAVPRVAELSRSCRFRDCKHEREPGCAVQGAIEAGTLTGREYESHLKLRRELEFLDRKSDPAEASRTKKRWKSIQMNYRKLKKFKERDGF